MQYRLTVSNVGQSPDLLGQAQALQVEAVEAGEDTPTGRELLAQAAQLRVRALGNRAYPVLVCSECLRVTGWTSATGRCDSCLRRAQTRAAYADPHGGFVVLDDARRVHESADPARVGPGRFGRVIGGRGARERALVASWLTRVDPDATGPISPEENFGIEVAHREEIEAADRSGMLIRFSTATHRFRGREWVELETTRIASDQLLVPAEYSAGLPAEELVEAWLDYRAAVDAVNRSVWSLESARREARRLAQTAHDDAMREQRDALDLLDES
jgi:hypothetical protein